MNTLVSIIIPVYNAEKYLNRCLDSIIKQKNKNYEVLLVNDGSTDSSEKICEDYKTKDSRFKVFHKNNGGVSSARNVGLDYAIGEWVSFIDADDYVDEDFLSGLDFFSECDVLQKSSVSISENGKIVYKRRINSISILRTQLSINKYFVNHRTNALWDKFIKKSIIGKKRFDESISIGEDFMFFLSLLPSIFLYGLSNVGKYYYVVRDNSAMALINKKPQERLKVIEDNIHHIELTLQNKELERLKYGVMFATYIPILLDRWVLLSQNQQRICVEYVKKIKLQHLQLLNWKKRRCLFWSLFNYYRIIYIRKI